MKFSDLGLSKPILTAVAEKGYTEPSPIQREAIPAVLEQRDIMALAQTGTGKTAGFTLPMLELLSKGRRGRGNTVRALVLTPTRELAAQVHENVRAYSANLRIKSDVVFGGVKINPQMKSLRGGSDVLVATPGRLLDLYQQNALNFRELEILVLDEADRMLDMGFIRDIKKILALLPKKRQNLFFSATFTDEIKKFAKGIINNPVEISVAPKNSTVETVKHFLYPLDKKQKTPALIHLIKNEKWSQALVFTRTKHGANKLTKKLEQSGITAAAIHGNKSQGARTRALAGFKSGEMKILVATDIAARGIDIHQLPQVVNFDLPNIAEDYVHRIGRTGRAGQTGTAVSFVSIDEGDNLKSIERLIQQKLERKSLEGFVPTEEVPDFKLDTRPIKPKKPKKPKKNRPKDDSLKENKEKVVKKDKHISKDKKPVKKYRFSNKNDSKKKATKKKSSGGYKKYGKRPAKKD